MLDTVVKLINKFHTDLPKFKGVKPHIALIGDKDSLNLTVKVLWIGPDRTVQWEREMAYKLILAARNQDVLISSLISDCERALAQED